MASIGEFGLCTPRHPVVLAAFPLSIFATAPCPSSRTPGPPRVLATTSTRPSPAKSLPTEETGHCTSCPLRSRPSAVACPLRICAAVNTTNPDFIRCHWESLRTNSSASSQYSTFLTPPRTRSHAASSISGSATGAGGIGDRGSARKKTVIMSRSMATASDLDLGA